jgi:hypothetical protein
MREPRGNYPLREQTAAKSFLWLTVGGTIEYDRGKRGADRHEQQLVRNLVCMSVVVAGVTAAGSHLLHRHHAAFQIHAAVLVLKLDGGVANIEVILQYMV